ncbi:hypothetical protein CN266_26910 [Bacillus cereus]|uniref:DUF6941 family protein n=1 Tax=Bacillus cereus TaxID=1396 RepID=UPI000BF79F16|nr:hypothetical protein [Bacillus cereus]PFC59585.1 hypothetical protein CN266_26910 [Bacillus cereus]
MPIISTFMYCEQAQINSKTNRLDITAPLHVLTPPSIPSAYSFSIVFGILGLDNHRKNNIRITLMSPNQEIAFDTGDELVIEENTNLDSMPSEARGFIANMDLRNVLFNCEGMYVTSVSINREVIGEYPIFVWAGDKNE